MTTNGVFSVLYSFVGGSYGDGSGVIAPVLQGADGNLFGAGTGSGMGVPNGSGAIFELVNPNPPPVITAQPTNATVPAGSDVTFAVSATSAAALTYQWNFDGAPLTDETNATLVLTSVMLAQAGSYTVDVANSNAIITSAIAILTVTQAEAIVTLDGLGQTYDGAPKLVTATTQPPGLTVDITYDGLPDAPTNAGSYTVIGTVNDPAYFGGATNTLVGEQRAPGGDSRQSGPAMRTSPIPCSPARWRAPSAAIISRSRLRPPRRRAVRLARTTSCR